jgi:hypothetical protein
VRSALTTLLCHLCVRSSTHLYRAHPIHLSHQDTSFADKVYALNHWCNDNPEKKLLAHTEMRTSWEEHWPVGSWVEYCRSDAKLVPEEMRDAFDEAVQRSGHGSESRCF